MRILLLIAILCLQVLAQSSRDEREIRALLQSPDSTIDSLRVAETWGVAVILAADTGGYSVVHFMDGRWRVVAGSGGACDARHAYALGIPARLWDQLLSVPVSAEERRQILSSGPYWSFLTRKQALTDSDLAGHSWWELTLMRNEIFAVHGRPFRDPELRSYFSARAWYKVNPGYHDGMLSTLERRNAELIARYQARKGLDH